MLAYKELFFHKLAKSVILSLMWDFHSSITIKEQIHYETSTLNVLLFENFFNFLVNLIVKIIHLLLKQGTVCACVCVTTPVEGKNRNVLIGFTHIEM